MPVIKEKERICPREDENILLSHSNKKRQQIYYQKKETVMFQQGHVTPKKKTPDKEQGCQVHSFGT